MIVKMDKTSASSSQELAQRLYDKNLELENRRRKSAQARVPSDPNAWQQMRENFETIILENHNFSEKQNIEFALWQLHYRRIEEFRAHYSAASNSTASTASQTGGSARPDRASKIRQQFKTFLSEATGFYHDLILKIRAKYGLRIGQFSIDPRNHNANEKDKDSTEIKKGLLSCHRCLIYLGDLARYKGLYGEGDSKSRDYAAASSYYLQAASLWPSSGNPHHQLAILATYSGDELMAVYRYFRSLAADNPFSTARDNLIVAFEKNRQSYFQLHGDPKDPSLRESPARVGGRGRARVEPTVQSEELKSDTKTSVEGANDIRKTYKAFCVRFVRLNGVLFTRTSLETFEEILSLVSSGLQELLSSGPEEQPSLGTDAVENGVFVVILVSILIFTVNNVKKEADGQSYADIVQRTVLLQDALIAVYELIGQLLKRCLQLSDPSSSFLLPGILVFLEWMACCPDVVHDMDDKKTIIRSHFWNFCISFFNKLLSDGGVPFDDEDVSCFTNMKTCDEGENEYQLALWEDFELRGFLPLQPAQAFLDFSREQFANNSKKIKVARVKRILAAGRAIADMITIDHKKVTFDSKLKRFVIGIEAQKPHMDFLSDTMAKVETRVEGEEEEDEVIVFKPTVIENQAEVLAPKWNRQEWLEQVQNTSTGTPQFTVPAADFHQQNPIMPVSYAPPNIRQTYQFQPLMSSVNGQASTARGFQGLSLLENGQVIRPGKGETSIVHPMVDNMSAYIGGAVNHVKNDPFTSSGVDPSIVGRNTSSSMTTSSSRVSANRPMRHLGPPPGFSSIRPKQFDEVGPALGQNPLNDDYSWLDGYQLQSSMIQSIEQPLKSSSSLQFINGGAVATTSFPFPGKQIPAGQGRPNLESLNSHHESFKQQYVPQQDQKQEQSIWKGRHFV